MKKIFKYPVSSETELVLPAGAKILSAIGQRSSIVLYALVDTDIEVTKMVSVRVVATGEEIRFDLKDFTFLGSVSLFEGSLIFHVYYRDHGYRV